METTHVKSNILVGNGNNGKGTFQELLSNVIGYSNIASLKVNEFDERFKLSVLEGKTAVIGDDVPVGVYVDDSSNFKSVVTGDPVLVEFKINPYIERLLSVQLFNQRMECLNLKTKQAGL